MESQSTASSVPMSSWEYVLRKGFAPNLSEKCLTVLLVALKIDDQTLMQGCTTQPPPLMCVQDWPCEGGCGIGYMGWKGEDLKTVGDIEEFFANMCYQADLLLGEPAACRWFLNWFDDTPRDRMRAELIPVLESILKERIDTYLKIQTDLICDIQESLIDEQIKWFQEYGDPVA